MPLPLSSVQAVLIFNAVHDCRDKSGALIRDQFWKLAKKSEQPEYYRKIKQPVDLAGIRKQLWGQEYGDYEEFIMDLRRLSRNAQKFHEADSKVCAPVVFVCPMAKGA